MDFIKKQKYIFTSEFVVVLFLFSGLYKNSYFFKWIPLDINYFFILFIALRIIYEILFKKKSINPKAFHYFFIYILFLSYCLLSFNWGVVTEYSLEKIVDVSIIITILILYSLFVIKGNNRRIESFFMSLQLFSIICATILTIQKLTFNNMFLELSGGSYLGIGRLLGLSLLIFVYNFLYKKSKLYYIVFNFLVIIWFSYLMFSIGARGPFLASIIANMLLIIFILNYKQHSLKFKRKPLLLFNILFFSLIILIFLVLSANQLPTTIYRFGVLFESGQINASALTRLYYYKISYKLFLETPFFGYGFGAWPNEAIHQSIRDYPHNIILEILVELGLLGFFFWTLLMFIPFIKLLKRYKIFNHVKLLIAVWLFTFLNAMVSGDLSDNRILFFITSLIYSMRLDKNFNVREDNDNNS